MVVRGGNAILRCNNRQYACVPAKRCIKKSECTIMVLDETPVFCYHNIGY
jgi:hypothetical protein